jgi:hypothetical protein
MAKPSRGGANKFGHAAKESEPAGRQHYFIDET